MGTRIRVIFIVFTGFMLLVDGFTYMGLLQDTGFIGKPCFLLAYFVVPLLFVSGLLIYGRIFTSPDIKSFPAGFFSFTGLFLAFYIPKLLYLSFLIIEILVVAVTFFLLKILSHAPDIASFYASTFLNRISLLIMPLSILSFIVIAWGMIFGRFNFRRRDLDAFYHDLPSAFDGFRIVHISDLHLGSLNGQQEKLERAIEIVNDAGADLILFTGDLVNNLADEADGWTGLLSRMKARHGKFAITGNHDYGEFIEWPDEKSMHANMDRLIRAHEASGFQVLMNESAPVRLDGEEIFIAGVENWGLPPFQQYGDLDRALAGRVRESFTILLSHDPSHWDAEVSGKTNIQLTLSGHTHGFQFGIRTLRFKWSPVQYKYPRWIGMYQQGYQRLHVSPGLGYIGYAGRIGIPPEITVITLRKTTS